MAQGAEALTIMLGQPVSVKDIGVICLRLSELAQLLPDPGVEAVGIFLVTEGDLEGRFLLLLSPAEALTLANLVVGSAAGEAADLDRLARSALGEVGNQLSALFLNSAAQTTRRSGRPSPPAVLEDMAGALVDLWLTAGGRLEDDLLIVDATFVRAGQETELHFLFVPEYTTLRAIAQNEILS
jgi:chemotaxis protein CheC